MIQSACWVVTKAPGVELAALGLRTAWATHQNGFETRLLFLEEGVWCLLGGPGYITTMIKDYAGEGGELFCLRTDLERRGIKADALVPGVRIIDEEEAAELRENSETINFF
ncbi:MAG: DsrH/TusB family sulfur metabolism protein [Desulfocurvibacter africanus]